MTELNSNVDHLIDHAKEYIETQVDIAKIEAADRISTAAASLALISILAFVGLFVLIFSSAGCAWLIAKATGNTAYGLFSVAGFYLIIGLVVYISREKLIREPIINAILKNLTHDK